MVKCAQGNMSGAGRGGSFFVLYCRKALWPTSLWSHSSPCLHISLCFGFAKRKKQPAAGLSTKHQISMGVITV